MPTLDEVRQYLASIGVTVPDFMLELMLGQLAVIQPCLAEHYPEATQKLIALYLFGLMGVAQGDKYVSSQTAPSGASQSFRYRSYADAFKAARSLLSRFDPYGCTDPLAPVDPDAVNLAIAVGRAVR